MSKRFTVLSLSLLLIVSSCGGGGSSKLPTVIPPFPEPVGEVIQLESEVSIGQSTELVCMSLKMTLRVSAGVKLQVLISNFMPRIAR